MTTASIIIPVASTGDCSHIEKTLQALTKQTIPPGEIILISYGNASPDLTKLKASYTPGSTGQPQFKFLDCTGENVNSARNAAIEQASGWLIIFLDEWLVADPGLIKAYLAAFERTASRPFAGAGLINWSQELEPSLLREYISSTGEYNFEQIKNFNEAGYQFFNTSNLAVARSVLLEEKERCGFVFDTGFDGVWGDRDLGYRLQKKGVPVRFLPAVLASNARPVDLLAVAAEYFEKGKAAFLFAGKYPELEATETAAQLIAALERYRHLTRTELANLADRVTRLEQINRIGAEGVTLQGNSFDHLLGQSLQSLYNSLLTAYFDLGAGIAYSQHTAAEGETRPIDLPAALQLLTNGPQTGPFAIDLDFGYRPSLTADEQLIDRLSLLIQEKQLEIDRLNQAEPPAPAPEVAEGYLNALNHYKILANEYLENVNHFRQLAEQRKHEIDRLHEQNAWLAAQIQKQQEARDFYIEEFARAETYALHVEGEYNRLAQLAGNPQTPPKSRIIRKVGSRLRNGLPYLAKK